MHDIKFIKNNPVLFDAGLKKRNLEPISDEIILLYNNYLKVLSQKEEFQKERNNLTKEISFLSKQKNFGKVKILKKKVLKIKENINQYEKNASENYEKLNMKLLTIPNIIHEDVPIGKSEQDNVVLSVKGNDRVFNFKPKNHLELGENLNMLNYEQAQKISGSRFSVLSSDLALIHRALVNYLLDTHTQENNYSEIIVPELVKSKSLEGTGQLPKFSDDLFHTTKGLWLIPTAEVCLTNLNRDSIINSDILPLRYTAYTNCFRQEAGASGKDTKGLIREHQFGKVELVSITLPEKSDDELGRMCECVEKILKNLDFKFKKVNLCSGDIGFASSLTFDFEVWMPGQNKFVEVSSCSNCSDFQSRRMKMRVKDIKKNEIFFPHTLNGSGLAIGRILVAILENYQNIDGSINIPDVLQRYMGGKKKIESN